MLYHILPSIWKLFVFSSFFLHLELVWVNFWFCKLAKLDEVALCHAVKPGEATAQYISKVLFKITLLGATYLSVLAALPMVVGLIFTDLPASVQIGGTSLMIVVGVAIETYKQIKTASQSQEYHGFM